jgi:carbon-monoxide dehydrogenase medium subunit/2-furoyl-CoA dehydrogenase FAD binding subunit
MKAAAFDYIRAETIAHALEMLREHGGDAKLIAGGQSLVPMMAMRLARPSLLIDINRLDTLKNIEVSEAHVKLGAGVRQRDLEFHPQLHTLLPLVGKGLQWVGHEQTRNRGTVGGSLVHADPSAELALAALVLEASLKLESKSDGTRCLNANEFFLGPMFTAVSDTEALTQIDWPVWQGAHIGTSFEETAIRKGDFAMASAACQIQTHEDGRIHRISFGVGGVDGTPLAFPELATSLVGQTLNAEKAKQVSHEAVQSSQPGSDMHATAAYRKHLAEVLLSRALTTAYAEACGPIQAPHIS